MGIQIKSYASTPEKWNNSAIRKAMYDITKIKIGSTMRALYVNRVAKPIMKPQMTPITVPPSATIGNDEIGRAHV